MKFLMKKENLFIRIAIGFVIGIALGFLAPSFSLSIKFLGDIYLNLIKMMIIPILVCAVAGGIINSSDITALKRIGVKTSDPVCDNVPGIVCCFVRRSGYDTSGT